jgi:hypothetical protein
MRDQAVPARIDSQCQGPGNSADSIVAIRLNRDRVTGRVGVGDLHDPTSRDCGGRKKCDHSIVCDCYVIVRWNDCVVIVDCCARDDPTKICGNC